MTPTRRPLPGDAYRRPRARQDAPAAHSIHLAAAPRARESIPRQQVFVAAKALRGGHQFDADRDSGE